MKRALVVLCAVLAVSVACDVALQGQGRFAPDAENAWAVAPFLGAWKGMSPTPREAPLMLGGGVELTFAGTFGGGVWLSYGRADGGMSILPEVYWGWPVTGQVGAWLAVKFMPRIGMLFALDVTPEDDRLLFGFGPHRVNIGFDFGTRGVVLTGGVLIEETAWSISVGVKCFLW